MEDESAVMKDERHDEELRWPTMAKKPIAAINAFILHPSAFILAFLALH